MTTPRSILVIDDEEAICRAFQCFFAERRWTVHVAASAQEGLESCRTHRPSVVFLDVRLPDRSGLDLLETLATPEGPAVIVITAFSRLETAVRAMQGRAFDYLVKPLDLDRALELAERVVMTRRVQRSPDLQPSDADSYSPVEIIGNSPSMQEVYKSIARAADSTSSVLITGATGTGKELVARAIHSFGPRAQGPFVAVNCGALPQALVESELFGHVRGSFTGADSDRAGRSELATGGTLFLDEVGELPPSTQVKLLRVLDSQVVERIGSAHPLKVDTRVLAATNHDLERDVSSERFRADLYYRLAVFSIRLPDLRDRRDDIIPLAMHLLRRRTPSDREKNLEPHLSRAAEDLLLKYDWPGNVRELKNALDHAASIAPDRVILPGDLPESIRTQRSDPDDHGERLRRVVLDFVANEALGDTPCYPRVMERVEYALIRYALERFKGNQSEAAAFLGLHRNTLRNKIRDLKLTGWSAS